MDVTGGISANGVIIEHRYQIIQQLGEDGTSFVYQAMDMLNHLPVEER